MDCFIDYIGLKGCKEVVPPSGYYINSLAGVSLRALDSLATEEQAGYKGFWDDVQIRAARRFGTELTARMNQHTRVQSLFKETRIGYVLDPIVAIPSAAQLQGVYIDLGYLRYASARLIQVGIHTMAAGTMDLLIYDFTTAQLLETISLTLQEGYNVVALEREYLGTSSRRRLFVGYRGDQALALAKSAGYILDPYSDQCLNCPDTGTLMGGFGVDGFYGAAYGGHVEDPKTPMYRNFKGGGSFGLQLDFQIRCTAAAFICTIRELLLNAWINLLGAEIMLERIISTRINNYTATPTEEAKGLLDYYEKQYVQALDTALNNLQIPSDICFTCDPQVSYQTQL